MQKSILWIIYVSIFFLSCYAQRQSISYLPSDMNATKETKNLLKNLHTIQSSGQYLIGHQDALAYGVNWKYEKGRSDIKDITGDNPALYGWEIGHIEKGSAMNLDSVPFDKMRDFIRQGYEQGGAITISWHGISPLNGASSWDVTPGTVFAVLPGGPKHKIFTEQLDKVAGFLQSLKGKNGEQIPVLFRPFHEMTGGWFWWGATSTSPEEYKQLFRFTVDYLKNKKGLHQLLYVYSTSDNFTSELQFLERYPGDDVVDVMGFDTYQDATHTYRDEAFEHRVAQCLSIVEKVAQAKGKIAAVTEAGLNRVSYDKWWTTSIAKSLQGKKLAYILFWRNAGLKVKENEVEYFAPYKGHASAADFVDFYNLSQTIFQKEVSKMNLYK